MDLTTIILRTHNDLGAPRTFSYGFSWAPDWFPLMENDHISLHTKPEPKRIGQSKVINEKPIEIYI